VAERNVSIIEALIADPPKLHIWGGEPQVGGLGPGTMRAIAEICESLPPDFTVLETGAGLSTLFFAACGAGTQICIAPDQALKERTLAAFAEHGLDPSRLDFRVARSEETLPGLTWTLQVDLVLIDGGHGWPTPFVDFCYAGRALRQDGILIVDDVQLYSCSQLYLLLEAQPGWRLLSVVDRKMAFFQKLTSARYLPEWGSQPFVVRHSRLN